MSKPCIGCAIAILAVGCSEPATEPDQGPTTGPIVSAQAWEVASASDDPFDDRPDPVDCDRGVGWDVELLDVDETIGIDTGACNYLGITQPALRAIAPGDSVSVQLWHFELVGDGPAHVAVAIDQDVVWELTIPIPGESALVSEEFVVPAGADQGAPIVFHLHNHGLNTWNLVAIE